MCPWVSRFSMMSTDTGSLNSGTAGQAGSALPGPVTGHALTIRQVFADPVNDRQADAHPAWVSIRHRGAVRLLADYALLDR